MIVMEIDCSVDSKALETDENGALKRRRSVVISEKAAIQNDSSNTSETLDPKVRDLSAKTQRIVDAQRGGEEFQFQDVEDDIEEDELIEDVSTDDEDQCSDGIDNDHIHESAVHVDTEMSTAVALGEDAVSKSVWLPGGTLKDDEELDYDSKAYHMIHKFQLGWSCLSFDFLPDSLGMNRSKYPHTMYMVAGSQAASRNQNQLYVVKLSKMYKTNKDLDSDDDESDSSSDSDDSEDYSDSVPELNYQPLHHDGTVNRLRVCPQVPRLVATWSDTGLVSIWDINDHIQKLDSNNTTLPKRLPPKHVGRHHEDEGYAMDWDTHLSGQFLTGACDKKIFLYRPAESSWTVDKTPFTGHDGSVEDVAWMKCGDGLTNVFASASTDGSIRLWDTRSGKKATAKIPKAHEADVNVCCWSPLAPLLLLSGGDDGFVNCWDMRMPESPTAQAASINYHKGAVSSVDWHPTDQTTFASSSIDNSVALWDVSVEADGFNDSSGHMSEETAAKLPEQLMFLHLGQQHITEIRWHPHIPGVMVSTAEDGFNVFKAENM